MALEQLAGFGVYCRQPVLVDEHGLVGNPKLPSFLRDRFEDALAARTRKRWTIEAWSLALQMSALHGTYSHRSRYTTGHRSLCAGGNSVASSVATGAGKPMRAGLRRSYH